MEPAKTETPAAEAAAAPPKGRKLLGLVAAGVFCCGSAVTVGIVAFPDQDAPAAVEKVEPERFLVPVPQILVNLAESKGLRLLQATCTVELATTLPVAEGEAQFIAQLPRVQDQLIKLLSSFTAQDVDGGLNKALAQTRIRDQLNRTLFEDPGLRVHDVYFTEFVIQ